MSTITHLDLIIIGAGPAGLSTAMHLIQQDHSWKDRMVVLEKKEHPRPKLCGGGITRLGLQTLRDMNIPIPLPIDQARVDHAYIKYRNRTIHVRGKPLFVVFDRPKFDYYLLKEARLRGTRIQENEPVISVSIKQDHVQVHSSNGNYQAKIIVCADGTSGTVGNSIKGKFAPKRISRTLEVRSPASPTSPRFTQRSALFDFSSLSENLQGYYWEFPSLVGGKPTHNHGVFDSRLIKNRDRAILKSVLERALLPDTPGEELFPPVNGAPIHWFFPENLISARRTIFVGDAAGVDVLFGEGIGPALAYGKIASNEIHKAFQNMNFDFTTYKLRVMKSRLGRYMLVRQLLAAYLYQLGNRAFFSHILWTCGQILGAIWRGGELYE